MCVFPYHGQHSGFVHDLSKQHCHVICRYKMLELFKLKPHNKTQKLGGLGAKHYFFYASNEIEAYFFNVLCVQGSSPKKLTFLADISPKALSPPPSLCLNGHNEKDFSFFLMYTNIFVFFQAAKHYFPPPQKLTFLRGRGISPHPLVR